MDAAVIVVGAGPAGLMLAGELRLAGVDVIVLERLARPTGESRSLGITIRTMEVFDQRDILPRFGEIENVTQGYFGGVPVDLRRLDSAHMANKTVLQSRIETVLAEWASELGADIRRGHEVVALAQDDDGVEVEVRGPEGGKRLRCRYLVGCDGGLSTVRGAAGFAFPGTDATREMFLAEVRGLEIRPRVGGENVPGGAVAAYTPAEGLTCLFAYERSATPRRRTGPPEYAELAAVWQRLTGEDISTGNPVWVSAFGDEARQVTEYRRGRVLLAGQAAHVQLPAAGWGMHTGIQDAVNLGWKLAAVLGSAPRRLLDTYHSERHPVGQRLLTNVQAHGMLFFGGDEMQPMREVLAGLTEVEATNDHLARMVSGLDIRYDVGPGDHPLLGRRMPHVDLVRADGKTSTTELLRPARGVLLDCADDAGLRQAAAAWADRVDIVTAVPHESGPDAPLTGTAAVLIRPDGHVAWVPERGDDRQSPDGLPVALERWFGRAEAPAGAAR